jgi:hypothetical protein
MALARERIGWRSNRLSIRVIRTLSLHWSFHFKLNTSFLLFKKNILSQNCGGFYVANHTQAYLPERLNRPHRIIARMCSVQCIRRRAKSSPRFPYVYIFNGIYNTYCTYIYTWVCFYADLFNAILKLCDF